MKNIQPQAAFRGKRGATGFTMVEIMFSVLILGILLGLLIGSVRYVTSLSKGTVDRATVNSIREGASHFRQTFGFDVPLVKDHDPNPADRNPAETIAGSSPARQRIKVHKPSDTDYLDDLHGEELDRHSGPVSTVNNPLNDYRYSERSLAIYLVGEFNVPLI